MSNTNVLCSSQVQNTSVGVQTTLKHTRCDFKQSSKQHIHVQSDFVLFTPSLLEAPLTDSDNMESLQHKNTVGGAEFCSSYDAISLKAVVIWLGFDLQ